MTDLQKEYQQEVKNIVDLIVKKYQPQAIIAFGSTATGKVNEDSDIDLLVGKDTAKPFWDRVKEILRLYNGYRSLDISVLTPTEVKKAEKEGWYFITDEILKEGKKLYERN